MPNESSVTSEKWMTSNDLTVDMRANIFMSTFLLQNTY
jgi:hypothetical protein